MTEGIPPPPRAPSVKRPESSDSFPALTPDDRHLLNNVLGTAKKALEQVNELATRSHDHGQRLSNVELDLRELKGMATNIVAVNSNVEGMRGDIQQLNGAVMKNLDGDAERERRLGDLKVELKTVASAAGQTSGAKSGLFSGGAVAAVVSGIATVLWLVAWAIATLKGVKPPEKPVPDVKQLSQPAEPSR